MTSLAAVGTVATPVMAQSDNVDTGVIIVTAQMREQNLQDIPLSITAVNAEMLEARGQTRIDDIAAQAPSLQLQRSPAGNSMSAFIRGVGQSDASPTVEPGVGIYVDDVYFGTLTASAFDLTDLDRVEVLRGPQGTLAGMNSQGGAIKIYSRKPTGEGGYVEGTIGTMDRRDFKASADFTLVPDAVFARITGVTRNRGGTVTRYDYACMNPNDPDVISGALPSLASSGDCVLGKTGDQSMYGVRAAIRIAPVGSPLEINLIGDYSKDNSSARGITLIASGESASKGSATGYVNRSGISKNWVSGLGVPAGQGAAYDDRFVTYGQYRRDSAVLNDFYASYANFYDPGITHRAIGAAPPRVPGGPPTVVPVGESNGPFIAANASGAESWGVSASIDYELSDNLALKSITGYRTYDSLNGQDNDGSPIVWIQNTDWFTHEQFSQELRLSANFNDRVYFTVGGIYYEAATRPLSRIHTPFSGNGPPDKPSFSFLNDDTADSKVLAGFVNATVNLSDSLSLEGGIRVTDEQKDYTFGRRNPDGLGDYLPLSNPDNPLTGYVGSYKATVVDYRAVIAWKVTPDIMTYAQFATGHKGGGISPRPYSHHQIRSFGPENLRSYEVGFKADVLDRRLRLNGAAFYMDYLGYQGTPSVCLGLDDQPLPEDQGGQAGFCGQYLNVGDARVKGFEVEAFVEPVDGFTIDASMSLLDFEFTKIKYTTTSIRVGSKRPGIGDFKWSVGAQYKIPFANGASLTPRFDVNYTPGYCGNFDCDPNGTQESYTMSNARLTYRSAEDDWSLSLEATNLFDKKYYTNKFFNGFYVAGQPGRPREVALTVRRNF